MKEQRQKMRLQSVDSLFTTQEERDNAKKDIVTNIPLELIHDFPNHPFKVTDNEEMDRLVESVSTKGVILPTVVRQKDDGSYEMISGHRRKHAAQKAGLKEIPCIIKDLTDDEATILMVDSNIQREHILPSEKAFAYKMKLEAMKHQGKEITSVPMEHKLKSRDILADEVGESATNIQRYIRLTYLIPELMQLVDEERIAFRPAVEISYLSEDNQYVLQNIFEYDEATPSLSQAIRLKKLEQEGKLTEEKIEDIMMQEKPNQKEQYKASYDKLRQYFPSNYSNQQIDTKIIELLEKYQREWKNKNRDAR